MKFLLYLQYKYTIYICYESIVTHAFVLFVPLSPQCSIAGTAKPSDLLAELQGRLPIRVTLKGLTQEDMYRILTEPVSNLIRQQVELMRSENVNLVFTEGAVREIARVAFLVSLRAVLSLLVSLVLRCPFALCFESLHYSRKSVACLISIY